MNHLSSVIIHDLWGQKNTTITLQFDPQYNFLIGRNGTGKTTVVNLIAAVLDADFERLDKTQFSRIEITLKTKGSLKKPTVVVTKTPKQDVPYYDVAYEIKHSATSKPIKFDLDALAGERALRGLPPRVLRDRMVHQRFVDVQKELRSLVTISWLSVNRHTDEDRPSEDKRNFSAVDKKLDSLSNSLVRYFSQLARKYTDDTLEFQKNSFLSLLTSENEEQLINFSKKIDIDEEKKSLSKVFDLLGLERRQYERKLNTHLERFASSLASYNTNKGKSLTTVEFAAMYNAWKSHSLVQHYEALQQKRTEIFEQRDKFTKIINELLGNRKRLTISERNELEFFTQSDKPILINDLSSGEKQLLIIVGEALLQEQAAVVYIADEPELSLHVSWQEQLTKAIASLNPNSQIIFATHSPDIVGAHSNKIIDMESVLA